MEFDKNKYKVYTWKNWMMLHWILNPGLAINELFLGQRVPKISLIDKESDKEYWERSIVPCPHCKTMHDGRTWSTDNKTAFKNWYGLYCSNCGEIVPCLRNLFSLIILGLTFPIWGWFRKSLKAKWLAKQAARYENIELEKVDNEFSKKNWIFTGLAWGLFMFLIMGVFFPFVIDKETFNLKLLAFQLIFWLIGGLGFGYIMKVFMKRKVK